jgi:2-phosphosulfolactate phosphatase
VKQLVIDCFPESAKLYRSGYAIVAVDVIRATTMAITAVTLGRRCFPVSSVERAFELARRLDNPILAGELRGDVPDGFEMSNSPAELAMLSDLRPIVLLSSSGTQLIAQANGADAVYLACFRNYSATAEHIRSRHSKVAIIGAGSRGEFREEDQIACAWVAKALLESGYTVQNRATRDVIDRWQAAEASACIHGKSAAYLRRSGQQRDLDFILQRIDDLSDAFWIGGEEVAVAPALGLPARASAYSTLKEKHYDNGRLAG